MRIHETQPYWTNVGGEWVNQPPVLVDGVMTPQPPILMGGQDVWVQPPAEHHTDDCPCVRCYEVQTVSNTVAMDEEGEADPNETPMTPEDLKRLEELGG